jgi:Lipocalin-like domain
VVVADGRTSLPPDAPPRGFVSYTGTYQLDGTKLVTHADGASNPAMIRDQVRRIEFAGKDRYVARPISGLVGNSDSFDYTVWKMTCVPAQRKFW